MQAQTARSVATTSYAEWLADEASSRTFRCEARTVEASPVSMARVWTSEASPDPASPDLQVALFVNGSRGTVGTSEFGRGRFEYGTAPGTMHVAPAFVDCDHRGEGGPAELLILAVRHAALADTIAEVTQSGFDGFEQLHSRAWTDRRVGALVRNLWPVMAEEGPAARLTVDGAATMLAGELLRLDGSRVPGVGDRSRLSEPVRRRIEEHVHAHLDRPIGIDELAGIAGCTRYHFARLFRATVGESPSGYVARLRMERAAVLLSDTELPVDLVANRVGFASRSGLRRAFVHHWGATPGEYRRERLRR